jgi:hypothetical protein
LDVTAAQARALVREVQQRDPSWKPRPSIYDSVEGRILANQSEAQQAAARLRELNQSRCMISYGLQESFQALGIGGLQKEHVQLNDRNSMSCLKL